MNKLEKKTAKKLGMKRSPLSGAGLLCKGDMQDDIFLIDMKFTYSDKSISIKKSDIMKTDIEAFDVHKIPLLLLSINGFERYLIGTEEFNEYRRWKNGN